jgi:hypothetical protein
MLSEQARLLAEYNAWMNGKLYAACATLPDDERKRDRGAFFGSIHGTLKPVVATMGTLTPPFAPDREFTRARRAARAPRRGGHASRLGSRMPL